MNKIFWPSPSLKDAAHYAEKRSYRIGLRMSRELHRAMFGVLPSNSSMTVRLVVEQRLAGWLFFSGRGLFLVDVLGAFDCLPASSTSSVGVAAHPAYTARFQKDLAQPRLRIPLTAKAELFTEAGRPPEPPRLKERAPRMPKDGAIPLDADSMPDEIE